MEFYLVNDEPIELRTVADTHDDDVDDDDVDDDENLPSLSKKFANSIKIELSPVMPKIVGHKGEGYCAKIRDSLRTWKQGPLRDAKLDMCLAFSLSPSQPTTFEIFRDVTSNRDFDVFDGLSAIYGDDVSICVKLTIETSLFLNWTRIEANNLWIRRWSVKNRWAPHTFGCKFEVDNVSEFILRMAEYTDQIVARCTIVMSLNDQAMSRLRSGVCDMARHCNGEVSRRTLLNEALFSDLEILAENGVRIKCHKGILAASSNVFKTMLESKLKEATSNTLDMTDMSKESVWAFLAFIYHSDLTEALKNCEIAYQLFCAGDMYAIPDMEGVMRDILLEKPYKWFQVGTALKMLLFAKDLVEKDTRKGIETKALLVLKYYGEKTNEIVMECEEFQELFWENPTVALEISSRFLAFSPPTDLIVCSFEGKELPHAMSILAPQF